MTDKPVAHKEFDDCPAEDACPGKLRYMHGDDRYPEEFPSRLECDCCGLDIKTKMRRKA